MYLKDAKQLVYVKIVCILWHNKTKISLDHGCARKIKFGWDLGLLWLMNGCLLYNHVSRFNYIMFFCINQLSWNQIIDFSKLLSYLGLGRAGLWFRKC